METSPFSVIVEGCKILIDYILTVLILLPAFAGALLFQISKISERLRDYFAAGVAISVAAVMFLLLPKLLAMGVHHQTLFAWIPAVDVYFTIFVDRVSIAFALIASGIGALVITYSLKYMEGEEGLDRYYFFMLLFVTSMLGVSFAGNFVQFYLFWELVSICSFFLIAFHREEPEAIRAAIKAFLTVFSGSICFLVALVLLYVPTNTFDMVKIAAQAKTISPQILSIALVLFAIAAFAKSAQIPLHSWLPDAMVAPVPVSAFLHSATLVKAGVLLALRALPIFGHLQLWTWVYCTVGATSMILAGTVALQQEEIKRLLAYSTISQIGYIYFVLGFGSFYGVLAGLFHFINHGIYKSALFMCGGIVSHETKITNLDHLGGLIHNMPLTATMGAILAFSLGSIPPFNGFFSELYMYTAAIAFGNVPLIICLVFGSIFSFVYSLRFFYKIFLGKQPETLKNVHDGPLLMLAIITILAALCIFVGLFAGQVIEIFIKPAALPLL